MRKEPEPFQIHVTGRSPSGTRMHAPRNGDGLDCHRGTLERTAVRGCLKEAAGEDQQEACAG
jgi:hypothetical protein